MRPPPRRPAVLGARLNPALLQLGDAITSRAVAEWRKRLAANGGKALFAPLSDELDPAKPLLMVVLGIGQNVQDAHAIAQLQNRYQVVLGLYDETKSGPVIGAEFAEATEQLWRYREQRAEATGVMPDRELRIVGHSYGGYVSMSLLRELNERGLLHDGEDSPISKALLVGLDNPWRGLDMPTPEAFARKWRAIAQSRRIPDRFEPTVRRSLIAANLLNGTAGMRDVNQPSLPRCVEVQLASAINEPGIGISGLAAPVNSFFSSELASGELAMCWDFFKSGRSDLESLRPTSRHRDNAGALRNLLRTLSLEADGAGILERIGAAARESATLEEFRKRYDDLVGSVVTGFNGDHTWFMENAEFLPWLSATLEREPAPPRHLRRPRSGPP